MGGCCGSSPAAAAEPEAAAAPCCGTIADADASGGCCSEWTVPPSWVRQPRSKRVARAQPLLAALHQAGRRVGVPLRARAMPSDNRRYAAAGLPAVGIGMGLPGYQTPAETPDRVQPQTLSAAARLIVATVHRLAADIGETRA